ncbi:cysteine--tRNA ligase [Lichenicola cladoniae]|uniref:Cysteine--tRNA ligase n=1 Tax=Lichenicola cladoniae TaxID=1484109 RepID=A0A6M8HWW4_9PROT|nr:cysteine--tRNA ligase [Lichenicola cladoniae]NPD69094.1 cysteine--tRNA ligase [Acetobacteraceae bacterium]QKE92647.1 cysteine--tRNA ligase [Lichenicola cladoniae]
MPELVLHDSLTRRTAPFVPLDPDHVRLYYCGPTVYDLAHIGNLRAALSADLLVRLLRLLYPRVTFVRNITDVDDKINARAAERGIAIEVLTAETIADLHADLAAAGILAPDIEPRATHHIADMITLIGSLIGSDHAYEADGHVLFSVRHFGDYGRLSGRDPDELIAGARVEVASYKRDAGDFVLWKPSTPELPGWDSPWGRGRPGWHIECSAMAHRYLGDSFDIHGGGDDLLFPHHENERAQSLCGYPGSRFANIWLHNAMLLVDGEKMSKSLGNFFTVREILADTPPEALRLLLMQTHYRSVLNFTRTGLVDARRTLDRFYRAIAACNLPPERGDEPVPAAVVDALCQDLNTPGVMAVLHRLADAALAGDAASGLGLRAAGRAIGILRLTPEAWFRSGVDEPAIQAAIAERLQARKLRDFARADAIRATLLADGIVLEDGPDGTSWRRA